jgi:hypothetical protein
MPGFFSAIIIAAENATRRKYRIAQKTKYLVNCAFAWRGKPAPPLPFSPPRGKQTKRDVDGDTVRETQGVFPEPTVLGHDQLVDYGKMRETLEDSDGGTSCHDLAITLLDVLKAGPSLHIESRPPLHLDLEQRRANDSRFLARIRLFVKNRAACCIRIQTKAHSFVVIRVGSLVESIEAWAGTDGGSFALDQCLAQRRAPLSIADCLDTIDDLLHPSSATRNLAFARFSTAGANYFTDDAVSTMTIEIALLKSPAIFTRDVCALLDRAAEWEVFLRKNVRKINKAMEMQRNNDANRLY